jgi:cytochrome c biogenesis factor
MLTTAFLGMGILLIAVLLALAGLILLHRQVPLELRRSHNVAIGIVYGTLQIMFGVIVGFSAFLVLDKYTTAQNTVTSEASDIVEIYRLAGQFPDTQQDRIEEVTKSYAQVVVEEEWPMMRGGEASPHADELVSELGRSIEDFEPSTDSERAVYSQGLERVHNLTEDRELRLLNVREGIPPILWVVLVVLAATIVIFTYFLGMESARLHQWAVAVLTAGLTLVIFTIVVLDHPFGEGFRVGPDAFERAQNTMEGTSGQET